MSSQNMEKLLSTGKSSIKDHINCKLWIKYLIHPYFTKVKVDFFNEIYRGIRA